MLLQLIEVLLTQLAVPGIEKAYAVQYESVCVCVLGVYMDAGAP